MKKISVAKWLVIMAIFCVFVFSACKNEPAPQKKIIVTGIAAEHNGRLGITAITVPNTSTTAMSTPALISGGTVTTNLFVDDNFTVPFTGSGTYMVMLLIYDNTITTNYYSGGVLGKSISTETTTIQFNEFIDVTSSVQRTSLSIKNAFLGIVQQLKE